MGGGGVFFFQLFYPRKKWRRVLPNSQQRNLHPFVPVPHYLADGTATPEDLRNYFLTDEGLARKMNIGPIGEKIVQHATLSRLLSTDKAVRDSLHKNANVLVDFYSTISSTEKEQTLHVYKQQKHVYMN